MSIREYKAYVTRELKMTNDAGGFSGYASAYAKDLQNDRIAPGAFAQSIQEKRGQIPILFNHDADQWLGFSTSLAEDGKGLAFSGQLATDTSGGADAYALLKTAAALDYRVGMSIGFIALDWDYEGEVRTIKQIDLWEASLTPFPAQPKAYVADVKSIRDLERHLRDVEGFSKTDAKRFVRVLSGLTLSSGGMLDDAPDSRHNRVLRGLVGAASE